MPAVDRVALVDGSYQHSLLRDAARLGAFAEAVAKVVRPGDVVADLGSGSGVLAWLAARAGARRVYAVEEHRGAQRNLRAMLARNPAPAVVPVDADAERWVPPERVDVALCEVVETGLLHEPAAAIVANVHGAWPALPRAIVPRRVEVLVEAVELHDDFLGFRAPLPGFRAAGSGEAVTDAACYAWLDLEAGAPPAGVDARVGLLAARGGEAHALRLRTECELAPGVRAGPSEAFCVPVVLPLDAPLRVRAGQALEARVAYTFAFDEKPIAYELRAT